MTYFFELQKAMELLAAQPNVVFMGQGVRYQSTAMSATFDTVPERLRLELPVFEDAQMGMATGMALAGMLPVCVFPRWNFLICAGNQLINHLDRLPLYSGYKPKVIIRTAIPSTEPFYPGPQHDDDFTGPFAKMARTIKFVRLVTADHIVPSYTAAIESDTSTVLVEYSADYRKERVNE